MESEHLPVEVGIFIERIKSLRVERYNKHGRQWYELFYSIIDLRKNSKLDSPELIAQISEYVEECFGSSYALVQWRLNHLSTLRKKLMRSANLKSDRHKDKDASIIFEKVVYSDFVANVLVSIKKRLKTESMDIES